MILTMPQTRVGMPRISFEPERVDFAAPEASGRQGGVQAGWPLWAARFEFDRNDPEGAAEIRAFFARLRGRIRRFYCWDPSRPFPLAYPNGFAGIVRAGTAIPFDGSATSWSQSIDADGEARITLNGLPAGLQISTGDYIGLKWDAAGAPAASFERRTMARAVLPTVATGAGQALVLVEPALNTSLVPAGAIAHLDKPACVMQLIPEDSGPGAITTGAWMSGGSINAIQDLRP
ncbi:MAG: hypothetical protein U0975_16405 [Erythrobacter sp.]|nr:hypothetical protein [Erythrobacter sp.]MDZ4274244.1 hypothetical protein [Erythrobacter sp.]